MEDLFTPLNDRERQIILKRFGLHGGKPKTLAEVGKQFGVTRERIRQLQNLALAKMRLALSQKEELASIPPNAAKPQPNTPANSATNITADHKDYNTATTRYDNARPDGPDTFGNPLVEF